VVVAARRWQRGGDSVAKAASLVAEAAAWQKYNFGSNGSALGSAAAAWRRWQQRGVSGGSMAYADDDCNGNGDDND
jgi:hypothetical protein